MPAELRVDAPANRVVADRNEDGRPGIVPRCLRHGTEQRIALEVAGRLRGVVIGESDHVPQRLLRCLVDALDGPYGLAAESARPDDEEVPHVAVLLFANIIPFISTSRGRRSRSGS